MYGDRTRGVTCFYFHPHSSGQRMEDRATEASPCPGADTVATATLTTTTLATTATITATSATTPSTSTAASHSGRE